MIELEGFCFKPHLALERGLGIQSHFETPGDLWVEVIKMQWMTSGEWDSLLNNGPKLAVEQPNKQFKKDH